jgi:hypothetical protein
MVLALSAYRKALFTSLTLLVTITIAPFLFSTQSASQAAKAIYCDEDIASVTTAPLISHNWSGYAATNGTFTSITGTWVVPQVAGSYHTSADATWVGIGGLNRSDLIQSGTQDIVSHGRVTSLAFIEMLPNAGQTIPVSISSGDSITVTLTASTANQWKITFRDNTNRQVYTTSVLYPSSLASAEWIEEAPSRGNRILALDDFGSVQFSQGQAIEDGHQVTIAQSNAQPIVLDNKSNQVLAAPSSLENEGTGFTVTHN